MYGKRPHSFGLLMPDSKAPRRIPARSIAAHAARGILFVHPEATARFVPFPFVRAVVGRDPACGVPLQGRAVSWHHAELQVNAGSVIVRDLQSTNGVQVEGKRIREEHLDIDDLLRVGDFLGIVSAAPWPEDEAAAFPEAAGMKLVLGPAMARALAPLAALTPAADSQTSAHVARVGIEGETGTGKTLVARLVHARTHPAMSTTMTMVDCTSWDAHAELPALIDRARSGSVYLDNFTALDPKSQTHLYAGLAGLAAANVTLIAGSQEPLAQAVKRGDFFPSLADAFLATSVQLPPLRDRRVEIPTLFRHLVDVHGDGRKPGVSTDVMERLCLYDWPCNVRELVMLVRRLLSLHGDETRWRMEHLPPRLAPPDREGTTLPVAPVVSGVNLNKLLDAVREAGGNIAGAALQLGITRERAYRLIDRLGAVRGSS